MSKILDFEPLGVPKTWKGNPRKIVRTQQTIDKWKKAVNPDDLLHVLNDKERLTVCHLLAQFKTSREIAFHIKEMYGKNILPSSIRYYSAEGSKWLPVIEKYRQESVPILSHIPIFHRRIRLERLEEDFQDASQEATNSIEKRRARRSERRAILADAREETRVKETGSTNILSIQLNSLSDDDLMKRRDDLLSQLKRINPKEVSNVKQSVDQPQGI